jgi:pimeloyl-ACP methyl ester carboxylesterase
MSTVDAPCERTLVNFIAPVFRSFVLCLAVLHVETLAAQDVYGGTRKAVTAGEYSGFVLEPPKPGPEGMRPWLWYAPVFGTIPSKNTEWILRQLIAEGFYIVGVNVGESMGNPAGRRGYSQFYDKVVAEFKLEPKARLLAQSRGGLMLYNWAAENPDKVRAIVGIYAVSDLRSYPRLKRAAEAYGMTEAELEKVLAEHNPIDRLEPLAKVGVPLLHIHGDVDKLVPLEKNAQVIYDRYRALGGKVELIVVPGKGHEAVKEFFEDPRLVEFLLRGGFAAEPGAEKATR